MREVGDVDRFMAAGFMSTEQKEIDILQLLNSVQYSIFTLNSRYRIYSIRHRRYFILRSHRIAKINSPIHDCAEMFVVIVSGHRRVINTVHIRYWIPSISFHFRPSIAIISKSVPMEHHVVVILPSGILKCEKSMETGSGP